ncbi:hypothetical protein LCGC14_1580280 [marine sediment metagenome]|uniref:Uncharacterized protein n=1 Tax=marine sediment metagenome TaxID=412755 RepID=A0A0F9IH87_9ZZZZ
MPPRLSDRLREYLRATQGRVVNLKDIRAELKIDPASNAWDTVKALMHNFSKGEDKLVRPSGLNDGYYKVVTQVKPVKVFVEGRERRPPFKLFFPRGFEADAKMDFGEDIVIREGDLVSIGGQSNWGKTTLALNFCGENIQYNPILMGNEYTTRIGDTDEYEPTPRFLNRLDSMDWVQWTNGDGSDAFTLLPVREDYAEHIVKDRINIIDWVNLDANRLYDISKVEEDIKAEVGRGIAILVLQKGDGEMARGGQFTRDFIDLELLIDKFTEKESMLTIGKVKEYNRPVIGRKFAFGIFKGVKIINFREITKCHVCFGKGWAKAGNTSIPCEACNKTGYVDKEEILRELK